FSETGQTRGSHSAVEIFMDWSMMLYAPDQDEPIFVHNQSGPALINELALEPGVEYEGEGSRDPGMGIVYAVEDAMIFLRRVWHEDRVLAPKPIDP
ncbi:MAG: hypothetical protein AAFX99_09140, partial [Myxococcota bacterium]